MEKLVLGMDIGPNSIGWAVTVERSDAKGLDPEPVALKGAGVRIFPEGVNHTQKGKEESKCIARRMARSARRIHKRRKLRKEELLGILISNGLFPTNEADALSLIDKDPYELRARGLYEELSLPEFGRALYHICQRRGFKSNRKTTPVKERKSEQNQREQLNTEFGGKDSVTIGDYLYKLKKAGAKIRGQQVLFADRGMYRNEFERLWESQMRFHQEILTDKLKIDIDNAIFYQRHYDIRERWGENLERLNHGFANAKRSPEIGKCELEPSEKRAYKGSWYAHRFRILQEVNNLRIRNKRTGELEATDNALRVYLIEKLSKTEKLAFDEIRKYLKKENYFGASYVEFNLEEGGERPALKGNSTERKLRRVFEKRYDTISPETRDEIVNMLLKEENDARIITAAKEKWGLDDKDAKRLAETDLDEGTASLSEKAMKKLIPLLEEGLSYAEAVEKAGYKKNFSEKSWKTRLELADIEETTSPLVNAALYQVRRVVNAIIREYGMPSTIRVELVRDLRNSKEMREAMKKEDDKNKKAKEMARNALIEKLDEFKYRDPRPDEILKYRLWKELKDERCPYTGEKIDIKDLVTPRKDLLTHRVEIEHIIPRSRSLDNSYMNKTLCFAGENREKLNRTPKEFYGHNEEQWNAILHRIDHSGFPEQKRNRFYLDDIPDEFRPSALNDTAHIAGKVRCLLKKIVGDKNVQITKGRATSAIRNVWGLNRILGQTNEKNRNDHRHHAIDAIAVALTNERMLRKISVAYLNGKNLSLKELPFPWGGFRDDVEKAMKTLIVSHRVSRKVSGALHKEMFYKIPHTNQTDDNKAPKYAIKKKIEELTISDVWNIRDITIRDIVLKHLASFGLKLVQVDGKDKYRIDSTGTNEDHKKAWKRAMSPENPPLLPNKKNGTFVPIYKIRVNEPSNSMLKLKIKKSDKPWENANQNYNRFRAADSGSNHHIVIFSFEEGLEKRWDGKVIQRFVAAKRSRQFTIDEAGKKKYFPPVNTNLKELDINIEDAVFEMSLSIGEMIRTGKDGDFKYYKVQSMRGDEMWPPKFGQCDKV